MYKASDQFERELREAFGGRYRLRWDEKRAEFHLEQHIGTHSEVVPPIDADGQWDTYEGSYIRARDGYRFVMAIRSGSRMPCPVCGLTVPVAIMETKESRCEWCMVAGRDGRYVAAYFPLNHTLIAHLRDIDPMNGGVERVKQRIRAKQLAKLEREMPDALDEADGQIMDNKYQIEQRPMVGYGPKTAQRGDETRFL